MTLLYFSYILEAMTTEKPEHQQERKTTGNELAIYFFPLKTILIFNRKYLYESGIGFYYFVCEQKTIVWSQMLFTIEYMLFGQAHNSKEAFRI